MIIAQRRMGEVVAVLCDTRSLVWVGSAALLISLNWFLFIFAVQSGQTVESSLGYYIYPLIAVGVGRVFFGERLSGRKWLAVALASVAVTVLAAGLGAAPWLALVLASTFAVYGALKKRVAAGPVISVSSEVALLVPLAIGWLALAPSTGRDIAASGSDLALLSLSGVITGVPLILFSFASKRLAMASVGLIAYLNPTLQFLCATWVFGEAVTLWHVISFVLIWSGLAIYSLDALNAARKAGTASSTSSMT